MKVILEKSTCFFLCKVKKLTAFCSFAILLSISAYFLSLVEQNVGYNSKEEVHKLCEDIPVESEVEFEKLEVIPFAFITLPMFFCPEEEEKVKNPIPSCGKLRLVYLDVICPPPWSAAVFS